MDKAGLSDSQLLALVALLDDEDPKTRVPVMERLRRIYAEEPQRLAQIQTRLDTPSKTLLEGMMQETHWERLEGDFRTLASLDDKKFDLERGVYLLSSFEYPYLRFENITDPLDAMANDIRKKLTGQERPIEAVQNFSRYLKEAGFKGNEKDYYDPDNTYFSKVLDKKVGVPITLSCLYIFLGRRLSLPFLGIGLPGHFIVEFQFLEGGFYLDPFHFGRVLSLADCKEILRRQNVRYDRRYFIPSTERSILARMMANLIGIYSDREDRRRAGQLARFMEILEAGK